MERDRVLELYDDAFAADYDDRFLLTWWGGEAASFELSVIGDQLGEKGSYLDVACGTGWVLSHFHGHERAGLDLSPAMLTRARTRSGNADVEFRQGDYRDEQPDWHGRWDLVSCMWFAYCYVDTVPQVARVIENLASWTAPKGAVFLPMCDPEGIGLDPIIYRKTPGEFSAEMRVTSFTWSWDDPVTGKWHHHLVAPHQEYLVELFSRHFSQIRILEYPVVDFGGYSYRRRALLATHKRAAGHEGVAEVMTQPPPREREEHVAVQTAAERGGHTVARGRPSLLRRGALRVLYAVARRLDS